MSDHSEWLSLIDVSGPFLAEPVLKDAFPQGLQGLDSTKTRTVRQAYDEWREALDLDDPAFPKIHRAWIDLILKQVLEFDENGKEELLKSASKLLGTIRCELPEHEITLCPDYAMTDGQANTRPLMLIAIYSPDVSLTEALKDDGWAASPAERMVELCRATDVRLGLVTNGEQWMFVDAPVGAVTSFATWHARLWAPEPTTLQAFINLLGIRRFFVDSSEQLPELLDNSLKFQDEVTDTLGEQVSRAVEVLIQALDRADVDRNRELLDEVEPVELYQAGLTVMMRIVFLLSAEERGLLLLGDERYEANYAVSTLRIQLRSESEEILERRFDAWSRLLSIFRAIFGGVDHDAMRLPAFGGSLFDPNRFPFLEGRKKGSKWEIDPATPLPIDNRTVLYLLDAVQLFQGRTLSYLALDIEQMGYVYEGLLDRTVVRTDVVTLDFDATKNARNQWVSLPELDEAAAKDRTAVEMFLKERTGRSESRVKHDLDKPVDEASTDKLLTACHADEPLRDRIKPYFHFLRTDRWGYPLIYPKNTFMVRTGDGRRQTGTHYTPKSLTEAIVKQTLEPLVYVGPSDGKRPEDWTLKSPAEILDLKICDPAMGSGAFLVQVCRWLSERLFEAWANAEKQGHAITSEGEVVNEIRQREPMRRNTEERLLTARRLIAERCLYGVDLNPLAVELAKLSIWLVTLAKGRPFGFLDHNLRCGDSLLGIRYIEQLHCLDMKPSKNSTKKLFSYKIDEALKDAIRLRTELRSRPILDIHDVQIMESLDARARETLELPALIADALVCEVLVAEGNHIDVTSLSIEAGNAISGGADKIAALKRRTSNCVRRDVPSGITVSHPFHWPLEFPEVFGRANSGFDAFVGNPPFIGGRRMRAALGDRMMKWLQYVWPHASLNADLCVFFYLSAGALTRTPGAMGFLGTKTIGQGDTARTGLAFLIDHLNFKLVYARSSFKWPGTAAVIAALIIAYKGVWKGTRHLDGKAVSAISPILDDEGGWGEAYSLRENVTRSFQGSVLLGMGFVLTQHEAGEYMRRREANQEVVKPYLSGDDLNSHPQQLASRWAIDFRDRPLEECEKKWPDLMTRVRALVKPQRDALSKESDRRYWWRHWRPRPELYACISKNLDVFVIARVTKYVAIVKVSAAQIFHDKVYVFNLSGWSEFSSLQSSFHDAWVRRGSSTVGETLNYTPSDYFDTYPFLHLEGENLAGIGQEYHEHRKAIMTSNSQGLTDTYNRFHSSDEDSDALKRLRNLHVALDHEVAKAYGWDDLKLSHGFYKTKHGHRFTLSEYARREALRRLLELNNRLHTLELSSTAPRNTSKRPVIAAQSSLFTEISSENEGDEQAEGDPGFNRVKG